MQNSKSTSNIKYENAGSSVIAIRGESEIERAEGVADFSTQLGISALMAKVLLRRGIGSVDEVRSFLNPSLKEHLPHPSGIKNIDTAAQLLLEAIEEKQNIVVYCDFDVDGLSAGSQLVLYLKALGADVSGYTPNRFTEGYGLVKSAVEKLAHSGVQLLVTVDCGIGSHQELALARRLGLKSIVIDHHQPHGLPPADVIVNPAQDGCPFQEYRLAAAGLVWMLLIVLRKKAVQKWRDQIELGQMAGGRAAPPDPKSFLDLAALGTICDMVPLTGVNRVIAHRGIEAIQQTTRPGLIALKQVAGVDTPKKLRTGQVAFTLGPRINAAGRLGDAIEVFQLLTTDDSKRAKTLAEKIDRANKERRNVEEGVRVSCVRTLEAEPVLASAPAIAIFGADFHIGVIGIVAQRLVEQYHRPVAVMAPGEMILGGTLKPVIKGSVRSIKGFHVSDVLQSLSHLLLAQGGHAEAGGFTLAFEKLETFKEGFIDAARGLLTNEMLCRHWLADVEVSLAELDLKIAEEFSYLAPFGVGNPSPILLTRDVQIDSVSAVGERHLRLRITDGRHYASGVAWGMRKHPLLRKGERVNMIYHPELNSYQGILSLQLNIKEVWR